MLATRPPGRRAGLQARHDMPTPAEGPEDPAAGVERHVLTS